MFGQRTYLFWALWVLLTVAGAVYAAKTLYISGDRTVLLPGQTTGVHHQFEVSCNTCHTSDNFEDVNSVRKDLNKTCVGCHKDELNASDDSHPIKKFKSPRMAKFWDKIDGRFCTSCHAEHDPDITLAGAVTLPGDFCIACHSEGDQDVRVNRPSHEGLSYDTCASSGCHNFHDNRALYEDFLVKHGNDPAMLDTQVHAAAALARDAAPKDQQQIKAYLAAVDAPTTALDVEIEESWAHSAHAVAEVGCASCHAAEAETPEQIETVWIDAPPEAVCADCHRGEAKTFALGRHGMRRHPEIAKPRDAKRSLKDLGISDPPEAMVRLIEAYLTDPDIPPAMSTSEARVSLRPEAQAQDLTCSTCHKPHEQDLTFAAVDACLSCHNDEHSLAYKDSPHFELWTAELAGDLPPGSGVTCATCHMPQTERGGKILTNHNQNDTLRPNEKMIRPTCMSCHGLAFSIDALADPVLVQNNFSGQPMRHIDSVDWALRRVESPDTDANQ